MPGFKPNKNAVTSILAVSGGIAINIAFAFLAQRFHLPLYLDTIGTFAVSSLGGTFPGVLTAVVSNIICVSFNEQSLYFASVNALLAIFAARFSRDFEKKDVRRLIHFILGSVLISTVFNGLVQWVLFGRPQIEAVNEAVNALSERMGLPRVGLFFVINFLVNLLDKTIAIFASAFLGRVIPESMRRKIIQSNWRQRPLSPEELKNLKEWGSDVRHKLHSRITAMILFISLSLVTILAIAAYVLYFNYSTEQEKNRAVQLVKYAASTIDGDRIDDYLREGWDAEGYQESYDRMMEIKSLAPSIQYLYVLQTREDGCHFVLDLETEDVEPYQPGEVAEFEEGFAAERDRLLAGEEIDPVESDGPNGWMLTVYCPIRDRSGNTAAYMGADVSMQYMTDYVQNLVIRVMLIIAGFVILIVITGSWITDYYTVYPVNSITAMLDRYSKAGDDQKQLDEYVRSLRRLNIKTGDEVEKLYYAACEMASGMSEQMREIRHYSEATSRMQSGLIITMADMVESRDSDTGAHVQKTAAYVRIILEGLKRKGYYPEKLTPKYMEDVVMSAPLHDVGKINIPDAVLNKPGKLTEEEFEIMKTHTTAGKEIMEKTINSVKGESYLKEARNMAGYHHERWDGKGYPEGLHGEVIPLSARVMAVADVFDALTSPRVYKPAFPLEKALQILEEGSGTQFDPRVIEVFMESLPQVKEVLKKYQES
ncbi:MAG: HD domain-containing protein [Lachnospiraceae bacterium]|nr:HD domain-containing protein [Lachnospiraceae bacterium]